MSLSLSDEPFAGVSEYFDTFPGLADTHPRIYVRFRPQGVDRELSFLGLVDTGAHYCILNEGVAELISDQLTENVGEIRLRTALGPVAGKLYLHRIEFLAEAGENVEIESTILVCPGWQAPCFLGYVGILDRLRFAVDPSKNTFKLSPLV